MKIAVNLAAAERAGHKVVIVDLANTGKKTIVRKYRQLHLCDQGFIVH